eukprot:8527861-Pyramimonas_sp.AAC.1
MGEVQAGKAEGPFMFDEVPGAAGKRWVGARRRGIQQGGDWRPIDDFSESGHSDTSHTRAKAELSGVDGVVSVAKAWAQAATGDRVK